MNPLDRLDAEPSPLLTLLADQFDLSDIQLARQRLRDLFSADSGFGPRAGVVLSLFVFAGTTARSSSGCTQRSRAGQPLARCCTGCTAEAWSWAMSRWATPGALRSLTNWISSWYRWVRAHVKFGWAL